MAETIAANFMAQVATHLSHRLRPHRVSVVLHPDGLNISRGPRVQRIGDYSTLYEDFAEVGAHPASVADMLARQALEGFDIEHDIADPGLTVSQWGMRA